ncbi:MAG: hypothetical protein RL148_1109 [Planctomycetota bacterium]
MEHEELLAFATTGLLLVALATARWLPARTWRVPGALAAALLACCLAAWSFTLREPPVAESAVVNRPVEVLADGYVGSGTCRSCHPHEHDTWHDSYHRTMTQRAEPGAVLGDFDGVTLSQLGQSWKLERKGSEHWIEMDEPVPAPGTKPARVKRRAVMTTGSHRMQLVWYETGYGRVTGILPFVWLVDEQRWVPRSSAFVMPPQVQVEHELGQWSIICLKCHVTHGRPRADMDGGGLRGADTHVAEFGISCEACHGPGEAHVNANRDPLRRYSQRLGEGGDPTITNPARLDHRKSTQVCGQCHGMHDYMLEGSALKQWFDGGFRYRPGDDLFATRRLKAHGGDDQFWSDGVPRVAGREYNQLAGSGCFEKGTMSCASCHTMHVPADDPRPRDAWRDDMLHAGSEDRSCIECHADVARDVPAHTHHATDSSGSSCVNCHMPHSTYALLKAVRTHRISSPDVRSTLATGRPNACNQCHLDRPLAWTATHLQQWYGIEPPALTEPDTRYSAAVRLALEGDAAQRALVAWNLGWQPARAVSGEDWMVPLLVQLAGDPYDAVRMIASRSLRTFSGHESTDFVPVGDATQRDAARAAALEAWRGRARPGDDERRAPVLLDARGLVREEEFQQLLKRRNNRRVQLAE